MKMKLMKEKKIFVFSRKILVRETTINFTFRASKSNIPFTCVKFPMVFQNRTKTMITPGSFAQCNLLVKETYMLYRFALMFFYLKCIKWR